MRRTTFALKIIGLLAGFYLMGFGIIAVLVVLDVLAIDFAGRGGARLVVLLFAATVAAFIVVIRGVFVSTRSRKLPGIAVRREDEPRLWQRVAELAAAVGTRAPKDIRLVPEVNAAVWEDSHLLGLLPGKRHMLIGVPLLLGLTPTQLDAVIAHELGHYSGRDTQMGGLVGRTRASVLGAMFAAQGRRRSGKAARVRLPGSDLYAALFTAYARRVLSVTEEASRLQEYAADRVAARIAGREAAATALRELPVLSAAYDFYLDRYISAGLPANLLPPPAEVLGGFGAMLADESRQPELVKIRENPPQTEVDKFDSHPPIRERIAAIEALAETDRISLPPAVAGDSVRAIRMLVDPVAALCAVSLNLLDGQLKKGRRAVDWNTLAHAANIHRFTERSSVLRRAVERMIGQPAQLAGLLAVCESGRFAEILAALPISDVARTLAPAGRVAREFAKTEFGYELRAWIAMEFGSTGRMVWRHSWAQFTGQRTVYGYTDEQIDAAVVAATAIYPDFGPLRVLITAPPVGIRPVTPTVQIGVSA